jgi:hypothetical protein
MVGFLPDGPNSPAFTGDHCRGRSGDWQGTGVSRPRQRGLPAREQRDDLPAAILGPAGCHPKEGVALILTESQAFLAIGLG